MTPFVTSDLLTSALPGALALLSLSAGTGVGIGLRIKHDYVVQPTRQRKKQRDDTRPEVLRAVLAPTLLAMSVILGIVGFLLSSIPAAGLVSLASPMMSANAADSLPIILLGLVGGGLTGYFGMGFLWFAARWAIRPERELLTPVEYVLIGGLGLGSGLGFATGLLNSSMGAVAVGAEVGVLSALVGVLTLSSRWAAA